MYFNANRDPRSCKGMQTRSQAAIEFLNGHASMREFPRHLRRQMDKFLLNPDLYNLRPSRSAADYAKFLGSSELDKLKFWISTTSSDVRWAVYGCWNEDWIFVVRHDTDASDASHFDEEGTVIIVPDSDDDNGELTRKISGTRDWLVWQPRGWPKLNVWSSIDTAVDYEKVDQDTITIRGDNSREVVIHHTTASKDHLKHNNRDTMNDERVSTRSSTRSGGTQIRSSELSNQLRSSAMPSKMSDPCKIVTPKCNGSVHQRQASLRSASKPNDSNPDRLGLPSYSCAPTKQTQNAGSEVSKSKLGHEQLVSSLVSRKRTHDTAGENDHSYYTSPDEDAPCLKSQRQANSDISRRNAVDERMDIGTLSERDTTKSSSPSFTMPLTPISLDPSSNFDASEVQPRIVSKTGMRLQLGSMNMRQTVLFHFKKSVSDMHPRIRPYSVVNSASRLFMQASCNNTLTRGAEILSVQVGNDPRYQFNVMKDDEDDYLRMVDAVNSQQQPDVANVIVTVMPAEI